MNDAFREKLAYYGKWTYRSAWALEIIASIIGLSTGIFLGFQAFKANGSEDATVLILASAPFFMVALAELTKIPIATLLFSVRWIWKPFLAIFLFLLAGITFETVFTGLERATTLRQQQYQDIVKQKLSVEADFKRVSSEVDSLSINKAVTDAQDYIDKVSKQAEAEHQAVNTKITEAEREIEGKVALAPDAAALRDELATLEKKRADLVAQQITDVDARTKQFQSQRDSYVERMKRTDATADQKDKWSKALDALRNPIPALLNDQRKQVEELDAVIAIKAPLFDAARRNSTTDNSDVRTQAENRRKELLQQLSDSDNKWGMEKDKARQALGEAQSHETERSTSLKEQSIAQTELQKKIDDLESKRVSWARLDQIQRLASRVYGVNPEDVGPDKANVIALLWFGSLAALAALAGPITAIVALGLQKIGLMTSAEIVPSKLSYLTRRLLLSWRWRRTRTKIVEKEIPVEKIVKEILYIPILTDDPEAVKKSLEESVPPEVADIVKVSLKGQTRGSPA